MDILSLEMQRLLATPEVRAALKRLMDNGGKREAVTLNDGRTVIVRRLEL